MTSRERIMAAVDHREPDRVPVDFGGTNCSTIHRTAHANLMRLMGYQEFREEVYDAIQQVVRPDPRLLREFGNDCYLLLPRAAGEWAAAAAAEGEDRFLRDEWGVEYRMPPEGFYFDIHRSPLAEASLEDLARYRWPDATDSARVEGLAEEARTVSRRTDYALIMSDGIWGMMQHSALLLGFRRLYEDLASDHRFITALMERLLEYEYGYWEAVLGQVEGFVQIVHISDDLGGQHGPNIHPETYRKLIKPFHRKLIEHIKGLADVRVLFHSCGSVYRFIPDFIDIGVDILNPVQISAAEMNPRVLKREFGRDITFWGGGIDTQRVLPLGTPQEVREEVKKRLEEFSPGGGFVFATVHNIQPNVPAENIRAMFETVAAYGGYAAGGGP